MEMQARQIRLVLYVEVCKPRTDHSGVRWYGSKIEERGTAFEQVRASGWWVLSSPRTSDAFADLVPLELDYIALSSTVSPLPPKSSMFDDQRVAISLI